MSDQENIQKMYTDGSNIQTKYLSHKQLQYAEIDEECWRFFVKLIARTYQSMAPMSLAEVNKIAL